MRQLRIAVLVVTVVAAAPAAAQYTFSPSSQPQGQPQATEAYNHVARLNLGVGFYNSGWYNCYYGYYYGSCDSGAYTSFVPFLVGAQLDLNLGGVSNISVGFTANIGTVSYEYYDVANAYFSGSKDVTIWEPTLDYVGKFGPPTQDTVGRFRIGGAMYFGPNGGFGGGFRIGGGASFLNANRIGIGLDVVLEGGSYEGYWIGGLQLLASPEFHF
jgi:hypothetical protein